MALLGAALLCSVVIAPWLAAGHAAAHRSRLQSSPHRLRPSRPYAALGLGCSLDTHLLLLGLSGMLAATFPLAFAYICDVVPEGAARISAIGSTIGFGLGMAFLIGPPLGSLLDHAYGPRAVFGACLWVTLANVVVALCGIVERPQPQLQP